MGRKKEVFQDSITLYSIIGLILISILSITLFFVEKGEVVLFLNAHHTYEIGQAFRYITFLGDGWIYLVAVPFVIIKKWKYLIALGITGIIQTLIVHLFKRIIFPDWPRPSRFFDQEILQFTEGVKLYGHHSFPSGHTTTAFAVMGIMAYLYSNRLLQMILLFLALLAGLSRMVILQHFFADVLAGSFFGIFSAWAGIFIQNYYSKIDVR